MAELSSYAAVTTLAGTERIPVITTPGVAGGNKYITATNLATAIGGGGAASGVTVADTQAVFTGTNAETVLAEIGRDRIIRVTPNGSDDTVQIQAALDRVAAIGSGYSGYGTVLLQPGDFYISDTLDWGNGSLRAADALIGARIVWIGPTDRPAIYKTAVASWGALSGVSFYGTGTGPYVEPTCWLEIDAAIGVDVLFEISRCQFVLGSEAAIKVNGSFTNLHWRNLRFDSPGGYAVLVTTGGSESGNSFIIDKFTYDHVRSDNLGQGLICIDNTANAPYVGIVALKTGRVEIGTDWSGTAAIFTAKYGATAQARAIRFTLQDVVYQDVASMTNDALICRDTVNDTGSESINVIGCSLSSLSAFNSGPWYSGAVLPPASVIQSPAGISFLSIGNGTGTNDFWVKPPSFALTDGAIIVTDCASADVFTVTLGGNRAMGSPINKTDGQIIEYRIKQDGTGSRTLTWYDGGGDFLFNTTFPIPTLTTTPGATDIIRFSFDAAANKMVCIGIIGPTAYATAAQGATADAAQPIAQLVNAQTGTTYTLVAADKGKLVSLSNGSAITLTLPQDSDATIAIGTYVDLYQLGAGQVTVAAGSGATLRVSGLTAKARAQYSRFGVQKVSANTWSLFGDLAAT